MAVGRMEFRAKSILLHADLSFVLPFDVKMEEVKDKSHYDRPTKALILLHGLTGTDTDWIYKGAAVKMADKYNIAIFMPSGNNSFYLDKGYNGGNYQTFVGEEFPDFIAKTFGLGKNKEDLLIGGLSMGGYGAIRTILSYPDKFYGCIALSSPLSSYIKNSEDIMPKQMTLDIFGSTKEERIKKDPRLLYKKLIEEKTKIPRIYLACGHDDYLIEGNRDYADFLKKENADYLFDEGPGIHSWEFWAEYLDRGLLYLLDK